MLAKRLSAHDPPDRHSADSVLTRQSFDFPALAGVATPNLDSSASPEPFTKPFGMRDGPISLAAGRSSFDPSIPNIVGLGSKEEVGWPNARRIVAAVADVQAGRDRPDVKLPGQPVSLCGSSVFGSSDAISERSLCPGPLPAFAGSIHMAPKPLRDRSRRWAVSSHSHTPAISVARKDGPPWLFRA